VRPEDPAPRWRLVRFLEHLDRWAAADEPDQDTRLAVVAWVMSRHDNPYANVRRLPTAPNLWFGRVAATRRPDGTIVTCSYHILEQTRVVRCHSIARLHLPGR
jgi:hypothetical protein